jgi:xanthocillin biosynthesis cytochrome P450 monooxygenase
VFTSRKHAFKLVKDFENLLYQLVRNRSKHGSNEKQLSKSDMLIDLLDDALDSGRITDQQYRDNLKITFITGHENVQLLLNSLFWELGRNQVRTPLTHMTTPQPLRNL